MSGVHAPLAPSGMGITVACAGSRELCSFFPEDEETEKSKEGTAAHFVAAGNFVNENSIDIGHVAPNGVPVTLEMMEGSDLMASVIGSPEGVHVEEWVDCSVFHPLCGGTPDFWRFNAALLRLDVWDYKFGHRYVDVFENWQLMTYAGGILARLQAEGHNVDRITVAVHLVQPRNYTSEGTVRSWTIPISKRRGYFNIIEAACYEAMKPGALCTPNPHCGDCDGRHSCDALDGSAMIGVERSGESTPHTLEPGAMSRELKLLNRSMKFMKDRASGLEEMIEFTIKGGKRVPGFDLKPTTGAKVWTRPIKEVITAGKMMGLDLGKEGAITPLQAITKGVPEDVIAEFSGRQNKGLKLIEDDGSKTRQAFSDTTK